MNLELAQEIMNWWAETEDSRVDEAKNPDVLYNALFDGGKSQFYKIPGLLFIVTNITPEKSAVIYDIGIVQDKYDSKEAKNELISIVREYGLKRLTFASPSCVTQFAARLKALGFNYEGRMKHAAIYNGKLADIDLYGFYSVKPANRRRRGRRNGRKESSFKVTNGASSGGSDSLYGEKKRSPDLEGEVRARRVDRLGSSQAEARP